MFSSKKLNCSNCERDIEDSEKVAILAYVNELNGMTHLKNFAKVHTVLCSGCLNSKRKGSE